MNFLKSTRRLVAVLVAITFCALLHVSSQPLSAHPATVTKAAESDGPRAIEEESDGGAKVHKKSILPIVLGIVGVGAVVAAVLLLKKTTYDMSGTWNFHFSATNTSKTWDWTLRFTGSKSSGNWVNPLSVLFPTNATGTYTVDGKTVTIVFSLYDTRDLVLNGQFDTKDTMSGSATLTDLLIGGVSVTRATWTATRASASAFVPNAAAAAEVKRANR